MVYILCKYSFLFVHNITIEFWSKTVSNVIFEKIQQQSYSVDMQLVMIFSIEWIFWLHALSSVKHKLRCQGTIPWNFDHLKYPSMSYNFSKGRKSKHVAGPLDKNVTRFYFQILRIIDHNPDIPGKYF